MSFFKRLKKKLKKTFVAKAVKSVGRATAKVVKYAAPVVGAVVAGPLGAAVGTGVAGIASQVGPNKNRGAALKRTLIYGGSVAGASAVLGLASGAGIGASVISSAGKIFSPSAPVAPTGDQPANVSDWTSGLGVMDKARLAAAQGQTPAGGSGFNVLPLIDAFGRQAGDTGGDPSPGDPRQGGGFLGDLQGMFGLGGGQSQGFFQTPEGETDWVKVGLVAGGAWLVFRKKAA